MFARFWFHARFLLVEGEKMSKSLGNFFTLRDLVLKGHKPSSIRYLLSSVPYRNQLNFTFDGLKQAATSVDRLRNFRLRLSTGQFPRARTKRWEAGAGHCRAYEVCLEDDLNTAQAQAAIFEMGACGERGIWTPAKSARDDVPRSCGRLRNSTPSLRCSPMTTRPRSRGFSIGPAPKGGRMTSARNFLTSRVRQRSPMLRSEENR